MTIPLNITTELSSLQAQVAAASPLANAPRSTVLALQLNAQQLVSDVQSALAGGTSTLDTWLAPNDPALIVSGVLGLSATALDQSNLSLMRGVTGRAASNLDQLS